MKARLQILALSAWLAAPAVAFAETDTTLERRAAEQERQIRQLEVQNQRLREQIEQLQEKLALEEEAAAKPPAPEEKATPPPAEEPEEAPAEVRWHKVRAGESLSKIARSHGTTTAVLAELNGIRNPSLIREGQNLKLPGAPSEKAPQRTVEGTHRVKSGETFYSIAQIYGLSVDSLSEANPDVDPKALRVGQELKLTARRVATPTSEETAEPARDEAPPESRVEDSEPMRAADNRPVIRSVPIDQNISFGDFAKRHGMEPAKLNALNGLQLESKTVLATGSRLYVSAQPLE